MTNFETRVDMDEDADGVVLVIVSINDPETNRRWRHRFNLLSDFVGGNLGVLAREVPNSDSLDVHLLGADGVVLSQAFVPLLHPTVKLGQLYQLPNGDTVAALVTDGATVWGAKISGLFLYEKGAWLEKIRAGTTQDFMFVAGKPAAWPGIS